MIRKRDGKKRDVRKAGKRKPRWPERIAARIYRHPLLGKRLRGDTDTRESLKDLYPGQDPQQVFASFQVRKLAKRVRLAAVLLPVIAALAGLDYWNFQNREVSSLARRQEGGGSYQVELDAQSEDGEKEPFSVAVKEKKYGQDQVRELFEKAKEELEQEYLGENSTPDRIEYPLSLPDSAQDGLVEVSWSFDNYDVLNPDGTIREENTDPEGTIVQLAADLSYREEEAREVFPVRVFPPVKDAEEAFRSGVEGALVQADLESEEEGQLLLPAQTDDGTVVWIRKPQAYALKAGFVLLALLAFLSYESGQDLKRKREERDRQLLFDYPLLVSKLSLLLGAGMTVNGAWNRIVQEAVKQERRYLYEEMLVTSRQVADGESGLSAYRKFGERCRLRQYRKLSSLLVQNLKLGSAELGKLLGQEARESFEERKALARQRGEEAGTKLLGPMMAYLVIVMVIVMVPGFFSFLAF